MTIGKSGGKHFVLNIGLTGISIWMPATRWTHTAWLGAALFLTGPRVFKPALAAGRMSAGASPFAILKHLTGDRRCIRVGAL